MGRELTMDDFLYKRHLSYIKYLIRHKWWVLVASRQTNVPFLRALFHDWSKIYPDEWGPYARCFYDRDGQSRYAPHSAFDMAWLQHQRRNKHHWQYWLLKMDSGLEVPMEMPLKYVREMIADWMGAGRAITGKWEVCEWYEKNRSNIILHKNTEDAVDSILSIVKYYDGD